MSRSHCFQFLLLTAAAAAAVAAALLLLLYYYIPLLFYYYCSCSSCSSSCCCCGWFLCSQPLCPDALPLASAGVGGYVCHFESLWVTMTWANSRVHIYIYIEMDLQSFFYGTKSQICRCQNFWFVLRNRGALHKAVPEASSNHLRLPGDEQFIDPVVANHDLDLRVFFHISFYLMILRDTDRERERSIIKI